MRAELKATKTKPQQQVLNGLPPIGRDTWMHPVNIHAGLWNKHLVTDL